MNKPVAILTLSLLGMSLTSHSLLGQKAPSPPATGARSVQAFVGGTQNVLLAVYPPSTYADGTPLPQGKSVRLRFYRSLDGGAHYDTRVSIEGGGRGTVGQGAAGSRQKPWIDTKLQTPVDGQAPYRVYLAVSAVVDGVESAKTNAHLTFDYYPQLNIVASPAMPADASPGQGRSAGGKLHGTYDADGTSITLLTQGNQVTGNVIADGEQLASLAGSYRNGTYQLNATIVYENQTFQVPVTIEMRNDQAGVLTLTYQGKSKQMSFSVAGRVIRFQT